MKRFYERHLPHQIPEGFPIFLTWNLKGAFPAEAVEKLKQERLRLEKEAKRQNETPSERAVRIEKILFAIADRVLDQAETGPTHLADPSAAKIVEDAILYGSPDRYELHAWCVMRNHVHVVLTPKWDYRKVTQGIKGFTAHEINGLHEARGRTFWQDESYDHWTRDEDELHRIIAYIENNPVAAGLCAQPADWPYSSARFRAGWPSGVPWSGK